MNTDALFAAQRTLTILLPEIVILLSATAMMTAGAFIRRPRRVWAALAATVLFAAFLMTYALGNFTTGSLSYGTVVIGDTFAWYVRLGVVLFGFILLAISHDQVDDARAAEFFGALLMLHAGTMLVAGANEIVLLFAGLELVSIPTYLLLYLPRRNPATQEAATKYFYLSIFSSALFLFGLAYLYGMTGVGNLKALSYIWHAAGELMPRWFGLIAVVFLVAGLGFRVAAVPFHFYAPDVYQGSPLAVTAMLSWIPKVVGFVAMVRVLSAVFGGGGPVTDKAMQLCWVIAVATMVLGNTVALLQDDLKRLLAYSSIAHAGYLMIGVTAGFFDAPNAATSYLGAQGVLFYLAAYGLMTLGVFGAILLLSTPERPVERVSDLSGLVVSHPWAAFGLALCLFSLAGVPPLAGFWGKFIIFGSALSAGYHATDPANAGLLTLLAVLGGVNAAIGAYYYLRIVVTMYLRAPEGEPIGALPNNPTCWAVAACAGLSLLVGVLPGPLYEASRASALAALAHPEPPGPPPVQTAQR